MLQWIRLKKKLHEDTPHMMAYLSIVDSQQPKILKHTTTSILAPKLQYWLCTFVHTIAKKPKVLVLLPSIIIGFLEATYECH
jgi:hypothetical protein